MMTSLSCRSTIMMSYARIGKDLYKSPFTALRGLSTGTTGSDNDGKQKPSGKRRGAYAAAGIVTLGGIAYAYRLLTNDKYDPMEPINWAKAQIGIANPHPHTVQIVEPVALSKVETVRGESGDSQASCSGKEKDDCKEAKCADSACLHKMDKEEELIAKANNELEKALKDVKPKALEATEAALKAYCEAVDAIKIFLDKAYCAIDDDSLVSPRFEEVWCDVYEAALKRCEKVKDAISKGQCAWELLCRLREIIENGKSCKYTSCNPLLITAEETLICAERELLNGKAKMDCVQSESRLVEQYKNVIEDFRRDLKAEMESLLTTNAECRTNLTENECSMILTHAYKKVLSIQQELALVQAKGITSSLSGELGIPEAQKELGTQRLHYENELVKALARQSQVHHDTLELTKNLLTKDFERRLKQKLDVVDSEQLMDLRSKYSHAAGALTAMRDVLADRNEQEERSERLRKLWTYCTALYNRINFGVGHSEGGTVVKDKFLGEFAGDEFSQQLMTSIPDRIESIDSLRHRFFNKIDKSCRNLGVLRAEEELSLTKYIWGYIQGTLTTRCEGNQESANTVYEILDKTAWHLRRAELLEAVLTLNKTEGTARIVCEDWLSDARAVLEASQTLYALMIHANAENQRRSLMA